MVASGLRITSFALKKKTSHTTMASIKRSISFSVLLKRANAVEIRTDVGFLFVHIWQMEEKCFMLVFFFASCSSVWERETRGETAPCVQN